MTRPGPKPKPPKLKLIEGNPGKRAIPKNAPELPPVTPDEPDWSDVFPDDGMDANPREIAQARADAREAWATITGSLDPLGLLGVVDVFVLTDAAICWARIRQGERQIAREGMTITDTTHGGIRTSRHPAITPLNGYRSQLRFLVAELGLSPSSRGRLSVPGGDDADADDTLD